LRFGVREPAWGSAARALTDHGVDCVVEVGGNATMEQSMIAVRNGRRISFVGFLSGTRAAFDLGEISRKSVRVTGVRVGNRDSFKAMGRAIARHGLKPVVDATFPFDDAVDAIRRFRDGGHFGKIAVSLG